MRMAVYGRMRVGRCIPNKEFGHMGCQKNVIHIVDARLEVVVVGCGGWWCGVVVGGGVWWLWWGVVAGGGMWWLVVGCGGWWWGVVVVVGCGGCGGVWWLVVGCGGWWWGVVVGDGMWWLVDVVDNGI